MASKESFPTVVRSWPGKREVDFLFVDKKGEFVVIAMKRERFVSIRNAQTLAEEKRIELDENILNVQFSYGTPYLVVQTE